MVETIKYILCIFFILIILISCSTFPINLHPKKLIVPDSYNSIQDAIDNASYGDTVYIRKGIYYESIKINKRINLVGESPETVVIMPGIGTKEYGIDYDTTLSIFGIKVGGTISSLQIRDFDNCIHLAYEKIDKITNCIIIGNSVSFSSLWLQGAEVLIEQCLIIGPINIHYSKNIQINNNIICARSIYEYSSPEYSKFWDNTVIKLDDSKNIEIKNNIIWGKFNSETPLDDTNILIRPDFQNLKKNQFTNSYSSKGFGPKLEGHLPPEQKIIGYNKKVENEDIDVKQIKNEKSQRIIVPDKYPTIQRAIYAAHPGDTIFIRSGVYKGSLNISKNINLIGESPESVIILPEGNNDEYGIEYNRRYDNKRLGGTISSLQIRNFKNSIILPYVQIDEITNCILISSLKEYSWP